MEIEQKINISEQELLSPFQLYLEIQKLKWEVGRLLSNAESERGGDGTFQRAVKRVKDDIDKIEGEYREAMYNPEKGMIVKLDRLIQESESRKGLKTQMWALWLLVIGIAIRIVYGIIFNKSV